MLFAQTPETEAERTAVDRLIAQMPEPSGHDLTGRHRQYPIAGLHFTADDSREGVLRSYTINAGRLSVHITLVPRVDGHVGWEAAVFLKPEGADPDAEGFYGSVSLKGTADTWEDAARAAYAAGQRDPVQIAGLNFYGDPDSNLAAVMASGRRIAVAWRRAIGGEPAGWRFETEADALPDDECARYQGPYDSAEAAVMAAREYPMRRLHALIAGLQALGELPAGGTDYTQGYASGYGDGRDSALSEARAAIARLAGAPE